MSGDSDSSSDLDWDSISVESYKKTYQRPVPTKNEVAKYGKFCTRNEEQFHFTEESVCFYTINWD
jgi:hypothetical protein